MLRLLCQSHSRQRYDKTQSICEARKIASDSSHLDKYPVYTLTSEILSGIRLWTGKQHKTA